MKNALKVISFVLTVVIFVLLNNLMFSVDTLESQQSTSAVIALVVMISLVCAFVVILAFVFMKLRTKK